VGRSDGVRSGRQGLVQPHDHVEEEISEADDLHD
jgi:hypothetical protein